MSIGPAMEWKMLVSFLRLLDVSGGVGPEKYRIFMNGMSPGHAVDDVLNGSRVGAR